MAVKSEPNLADRQWSISRTFNAPRDVVYRAWTDPKQVARWWGPKVFTNPVCELDFRPGGKYMIAMQSPDGHRYPMRGEERETFKKGFGSMKQGFGGTYDQLAEYLATL